MPANDSLIVLAAGRGRRMGKKIPKMLLPLCGRPLLYWTLSNLERSAQIRSVVLAVPSAYRSRIEKNLARWKIRKVFAVVPGGKERTDSTRNALRALPRETEWVGIHDAARPFVTPDQIKKVYRAARRTGCACLAVPSKDTVKLARARGPVIEKTIPRDRCWLAQTPQVFRRDIAEKIHRSSSGSRFSDDASIAESLGYEVVLVPGSYENLKITTPEDLRMAEHILKSRRAMR